MALKIDTYSNQVGGFSFFKAVGHPLTADKIGTLLSDLSAGGLVALYDPLGHLETFAELHDVSELAVETVFVQAVERVGKDVLGRTAMPIAEIGASKASALLIPAFDTTRLVAHIRHLLPDGMRVVTLDDARLPDAMLSNPRKYLDPLNFATNHGFLRDGGGRHTRLVTANYWSGYGARDMRLWLRLFDSEGKVLATWEQDLPDGPAGIILDSAEIRARFGLGEFAGTLFIHALGARGHDVVKYAVDTYGDAPEELSCTHDANAWPADYYAGLPAANPGERIVLWLQNAHPNAVPAGSMALNLMGSDDVRPIDRSVPGFGTISVDPAELFPDAAWPAQFELWAGKHVVRPRYEVVAGNRRNRIAHVNVERTDLKGDPNIPGAMKHLGKAYVLPAPVLPMDRYRTFALPTPMTRGQEKQPIAALLIDADGTEIARRPLGVLKRSDSVALEAAELMNGSTLPSGYGHLEFIYDFSQGGEDAADGWLHGLFRYEDTDSGHAADTSFGAHVFNTVMTYKNEPQSYGGPPPGLSTRLFLRLGNCMKGGGVESMCHLIYAASKPWHATSQTELILTGADGLEIASASLAIPCGGSRLWRAGEVFSAVDIQAAGDGGYVLIRDTTCRLFGYHGLIRDGVSFSLDHMFGF